MALNPNTNPNFSGRITAPDANYPYGSSKDETGAGLGDGTPYFKARADDVFGFQQWLLNESGIVPSGNADNVNNSDYGDALRKILVNNVITTYVTASNPAWIPDPLTKTIEWTIVGGGGGGGGIDGVTGKLGPTGGGSGAGASFLTDNFVDATYALVIGSGGLGGAAGNNDGSGGGTSSIVSSSISISAGGGLGGRGETSATESGESGRVGGTSSGGDLNLDGGASIPAHVSFDLRSGKGASGASIFGGSVLGKDVGGSGLAAVNPGAGGGGAFSSDATNYAGGDGADGIIIIKEYK